ncbi:hypothetical protein TNCV_4532251, partial [Trichonephila clavipes]
GHKGQILLLGGACKEQLPAPGNRSNERRYREKDLATREEKKGRNVRERVTKSRGGEKVDRAERSKLHRSRFFGYVNSLWFMPQLKDDNANFILQLDDAPPQWSVNGRDYLDGHLIADGLADNNVPLTNGDPEILT